MPEAVAGCCIREYRVARRRGACLWLAGVSTSLRLPAYADAPTGSPAPPGCAPRAVPELRLPPPFSAGCPCPLSCRLASDDSYYVQYIERCLREDLWDIQKTYMEREDSRFWVAESEGEVVTIVSAKPPPVI
ncbi:unnamed protein product [Caretta caretta]